eukprot:7273474-Prymnesium_polylepis.1
MAASTMPSVASPGPAETACREGAEWLLGRRWPGGACSGGGVCEKHPLSAAAASAPSSIPHTP